MVQTIDTKNPDDTGHYQKEFEHLAAKVREPLWMTPLRKVGMSRFVTQGFPTRQHEDWRFTNVTPIARFRSRTVFGNAENGAAAQLAERSPFTTISGHRLVFVDGLFNAESSAIGSLPNGVEIGSVASALASGASSKLLEDFLGLYAEAEGNPFAALNQAMFQDGAFIHVPAGVEVADPIQVVYIASGKAAGAAIQPRNVIIAEANCHLTVIETYLSDTTEMYFTNSVTELFAGDRARVELLKFQDEAPEAYHIAGIHGSFGRASNVSVHSFALGSRLSRNNIRVHLAGEGLECVLNGLYLTRGEQVADHHMIVEHAHPHCASHEYFNGILDDKSRGVFHGRILVREIAQKTDAKQTNKNLLLSDDAIANTKPQLEIYADDVKCTHGATVGQLNEEAIFYLRSRGIGTDTARRMLIHAFAGEIIERIQCQAARETLDRLVWDRLEANPHLAGAA